MCRPAVRTAICNVTVSAAATCWHPPDAQRELTPQGQLPLQPGTFDLQVNSLESSAELVNVRQGVLLLVGGCHWRHKQPEVRQSYMLLHAVTA